MENRHPPITAPEAETPQYYSPGTIVRLTYERKGMRQEDFEKLAGVSNLSNFCLDKAGLDIHSARKVGATLGFEEKSEDMRRFTLLATGVDVSKSPAQILQAVKDKDMESYEGLRRLFDLTGLTRDELAEKAGVPTTTLRPWTTSEKGGHISVETAIPELAKACGFEKSEHAFRAIFGGGYARRTTPEVHDTRPTPAPADDYADKIKDSRKNRDATPTLKA